MTKIPSDGDFEQAMNSISTLALSYFIERLEAQQFAASDMRDSTRIFSVEVPGAASISISKKFDVGRLKAPIEKLADKVRESKLDAFVELPVPLAIEWSFSRRDASTNISIRGYKVFDFHTGLVHVKLDVGMNP